ncbi:MAG: NAD-dependent epimerase/dehydratase family protein [Capsulimonadaceae bacterium]
MRIFVIGATGVLGRAVIPRLLEHGHHVRAVCRTVGQALRLRRLDVEAFEGDILNAESLDGPLGDCEAVLQLATAIPKGGRIKDWSANDRIRREGTANLVEAAVRAGATRFVQPSTIYLYGDCGERAVDESAPIDLHPRTVSAAEMEAIVHRSPLDWCILRAGTMYGPHTGREQHWEEEMVTGVLRMPGNGSGYLSLIHETDLARAIVVAAESAASRTIYNVVDNQPVTYRKLYGYLATLWGFDEPPQGGAAAPSVACSNARFKAELDWRPAFCTFRSGMA